jgi:hypothetical protein
MLVAGFYNATSYLRASTEGSNGVLARYPGLACLKSPMWTQSTVLLQEIGS